MPYLFTLTGISFFNYEQLLIKWFFPYIQENFESLELYPQWNLYWEDGFSSLFSRWNNLIRFEILSWNNFPLPEATSIDNGSSSLENVSIDTSLKRFEWVWIDWHGHMLRKKVPKLDTTFKLTVSNNEENSPKDFFNYKFSILKWSHFLKRDKEMRGFYFLKSRYFKIAFFQSVNGSSKMRENNFISIFPTM